MQRVVVLVMLVGCDRVFGLEPLVHDDATDAGLGAWNDPVVLGNILAGGDDPSLPEDQLELFFNGSNDVRRIQRVNTMTSWSAPVIVAAVSSASAETTPEVSMDGLTMYLASNRPGGLGGHDIYVATRGTRGDPWSAPARIPEVSSSVAESSAVTTEDGLDLVMARVNGNDDLYESTRVTPSDRWSTPVLLEELNTASHDRTPYVTPDGLAVYFSSDRDGGDFDLYVGRRASRAERFGPPIRIDELSLAGGNDSDPWVSRDERSIYFVRDDSVTNNVLWFATR